MASDDTLPVTFAVPGQSGPVAPAGRGSPAATPAPLPGQVKASVRVATLRDGSAPVRVTAVPGEDIVALTIDDGPVLLLHPATARDLLLGPAALQRGGGGDVAVQAQLAWPGVDPGAGTRDLADIGGAVLTGFQILTGLVEDPAADFAASQVVQRVDGQVDAGVYALQAGRLDKLKGSGARVAKIAAGPGPLLVLIHGTFVETTSTFERLWLDHAGSVGQLFAKYHGAVYALDHPTLGASPIDNARTLVDALPDGARLHLMTHSRGGLVAEVLARVAGQNGVGDADLACFADAAHLPQQQALRELGALVKARGIAVERVVRVACPARGTLLASQRLDAYLSVLKWTLQLAGVPLVPAFVDFVCEVARRRADPLQIPGLAAMIPGTPLVDWLNAAPAPIPGDLRVIAGDLQRGSTLGSWIKALLADAYYWTDNDIVVHTRSMYGGAPRQGGATYLLDQSANATHFTYFANDRTADAAVRALTEAQPDGFGTIGPLSWAGEDAGGTRGAAGRGADPAKPAVFVLPGVFGSHLRQGPAADGERLWLGPRTIGGFDRLAWLPGGADGVTEDGPIGAVYAPLMACLQATHEVVAFGYDWRLPLQDEAARLADRVREALDARRESGQPVRLLAHSSGGLLARTMQIVDPATWQRLMAHPQARLVMLGTPNDGSWLPMQLLSGDDSFGGTLAAIGALAAGQRARSLLARMPGLLQLQAGLLDPRYGLDREERWQQLADDDRRLEEQQAWWQRPAGDAAGCRWGVPPQAVLDLAGDLRRKLDAQLDGALRDGADKLRLVVGRDRDTPAGFEVGSGGLVYLDAAAGGDGRVTLDSALLPGVAAWSVDSAHGALPGTVAAFDAYLDLLVRGTTSRLPTLVPGRGAGAASPRVRSRPARRPPAALPAGGIDEIFAGAAAPAPGSAGAPGALPQLQLTVLNGNLRFVGQPLILGHYGSLQLTGTEAVVDRHLQGAMSTALQSGLYPEAPGTHRIFFNTWPDDDNPWRPPRPRAVIVVGLGFEGALGATQLEFSICQGTKAWAQRAAEEGPAGAAGGTEIAATLVGSGGIGVAAGESARAIARGVQMANERLASTNWPRVTRLTIVEWYLDRAGDAWRGLHVLAQAHPRTYALEPVIARGTGPLRRQPDSGYRGANYDLINTTTASDGTISFALDTRRARTEVRAERTQAVLLRKLVERAATARSSDPRLGHTLFQLLVPLELRPFLSGTDRMVLQLDEGTAPIPWELLDAQPGDDSGGAAEGLQPWAIRTRLLRKLATSEFRNAPRDASADAAVLVIGEPRVDDSYPPLPGARDEAMAVARQLTGPGGIGESRLTALLDQPEFDLVIGALMARPWRIVHVAGHGAPVQRDTAGKVTSLGGVVLSEGVFLGPDEIGKLPVVPELVFVNCCHLGAHDAAQTLTVQQPVAFAAGVADALIRIGVRCVVAAGWAVDDRPAEVFAQSFYRALLGGRPFIDAVAAARRDARDAAPESKTWAAYQCYGDPDWVFSPGTGDAQAAGGERDEYQVIASSTGLELALENLAVGARYAVDRDSGSAAARRQELQERLRDLEHRYGRFWDGIGAVAEAFAVAWDAAGDSDAAIAWYERALQANDASASIRAHEQFGKLRVHRAWSLARAAACGSPALAQGRQEITDALRELQGLAALQPTIERLSLCGSAWKRLARLEDRDGMAGEGQAALAMALDAYAKAEALATASQDPQLFVPGLERMALELVVNLGRTQWTGFDAAAAARLRRGLQTRHDSDPDFRSVAGLIDLDFYSAAAAADLAAAAAGLACAWSGLRDRVRSPALWGPVVDQADFVLTRYQRSSAAATERAAAAGLQAQLACYVM